MSVIPIAVAAAVMILMMIWKMYFHVVLLIFIVTSRFKKLMYII